LDARNMMNYKEMMDSCRDATDLFGSERSYTLAAILGNIEQAMITRLIDFIGTILYYSLYYSLYKNVGRPDMNTATKQANFLLPQDLLNELKMTVSKRQQSKVVADALRKELKRLKLEKVLKTSFGAWKEKDHPELKGGTEAFVRSLRKSSRLSRSK